MGQQVGADDVVGQQRRDVPTKEPVVQVRIEDVLLDADDREIRIEIAAGGGPGARAIARFPRRPVGGCGAVAGARGEGLLEGIESDVAFGGVVLPDVEPDPGGDDFGGSIQRQLRRQQEQAAGDGGVAAVDHRFDGGGGTVVLRGAAGSAVEMRVGGDGERQRRSHGRQHVWTFGGGALRTGEGCAGDAGGGHGQFVDLQYGAMGQQVGTGCRLCEQRGDVPAEPAVCFPRTDGREVGVVIAAGVGPRVGTVSGVPRGSVRRARAFGKGPGEGKERDVASDGLVLEDVEAYLHPGQPGRIPRRQIGRQLQEPPAGGGVAADQNLDAGGISEVGCGAVAVQVGIGVDG